MILLICGNQRIEFQKNFTGVQNHLRLPTRPRSVFDFGKSFRHRGVFYRTSQRGALEGGNFMLYWSLVFFVVSLLAGVFGFGNIAATTAGIAQILFYVFLIFFVVTLVAGLASGGRRKIQ